MFRFNFSEAAMLIQGSLRIFSLKVDFLHEQIYELYQNKTGKKSDRKAGT